MKFAYLPKELFVPNEEIHVIMQSKQQFASFEAFCASAPPFSIALDGIVNDGPKFDKTGPRINIDHHTGVARLATRCTAAQVEMKIAQGLLKAYEQEGVAKAIIFVNDCDEDVCLSLFLLKYAHIPAIIRHPSTARLIEITDKLDTTGGMYHFSPQSKELRDQSWVMDPYKHFMIRGGTAKQYTSQEERNHAYLQVIDEVENRIIRYLTGNAKKALEEFIVDTSFNIVYRDSDSSWALVDTLGAQGRTGMAFASIPAYVYLKYADGANNRYQYSIGRASEFITYFNIPELYTILNQAEGDSVHEKNKWGGSSIIGGSPPEGSTLSPQEIIAIIQKYVSSNK
jgi:hypothetical protein